MTKYDVRCTYAIVANSTQLFSLGLEGASILIPCYIAATRYMVTGIKLDPVVLNFHTTALPRGQSSALSGRKRGGSVYCILPVLHSGPYARSANTDRLWALSVQSGMHFPRP